MKKKRIHKKTEIDFSKPINQEQFGFLVGIPQQTISKLAQYDILPPGGTVTEWIRCLIRFELGVIYGRRGWKGVAIARCDIPDDQKSEGE